jgi:protein-tyrosine-phosphatase
MAEALTKKQYGEQVFVKSVGLKPGTPEDTKNAMETLQIHFGINPSRHIPLGIQGLNFQDFDLVVAMDKYVAKKFKDVLPSKLLTWNIDDPYGNDLEEYRRCALRINQQVSRLPIPISST